MTRDIEILKKEFKKSVKDGMELIAHNRISWEDFQDNMRNYEEQLTELGVLL